MLRVNKRGRSGPVAKLTVGQVRKARKQAEAGVQIKELARKYNVSWLTMRDAVRGYGAYRDV